MPEINSSDLRSFVKLSPKETVLDTWEVVDDPGKPTLGEIIVSLIFAIVIFVVLRTIITEVFIAMGIWSFFYRLGVGFLFVNFIRLVEIGIPAFALGWPLLTRPRTLGYFYLTNWRLLYFAHGQNRFRTFFYVATANLADVLGIRTFYTEGLFGKQQLRIMIHTRFRDGIAIEAGDRGSLLARLPGIGKLLSGILVRNTLGKDAFAMLPVLFARVRQNADAAATSSLTY